MRKEKFRSWFKALREFIPLVAFAVALGLFGNNLLELLREWTGLERVLQVGRGRAQDIAFTGLALLMAYLIVRRQRSARLDAVQLTFLVGGLELYLIARCGNLDKFLVRFDACNAIAYGDALAVPALISLFLAVYHRLPSWKKSQSPSVPSYDASLGDGVDLFGYGNLARRVKDYLLDPKNPTSGTIGINGVFGIGKSSFFDLLIRELKESSVKVIHFTPWRSSSRSFLSQLVDQLLQSQLGDEGAIASALKEYESLLSEVKVPAGIGRLLRARRIGAENSESNAKQLVSQLLSKHKQRCLVIVDDLDRLLPTEIVEVLKLLRNTADFDRITYVLAYDKVLVEESLRLEQPIGTEFLDKFIEAELMLPSIESDRLVKLCFETLEKLMPVATSGFTAESFSREVGSDLQRFLHTPRQAKRLALTTKLHYGHLTDDLFLPDVVLLQNLRLRYPKVVGLIARLHKEILSNEQKSYNGHALATLAKDPKTQKTRLESLLYSEGGSLGITASEVQAVVEAVGSLFPVSVLTYESHFYSIRHPRNLWRYLKFEIPGDALPDQTYRQLLTYDGERLKTELKEVLAKNQTRSLCTRISADMKTNPVRLLNTQLSLARCETLSGTNSLAMTATWLEWARYFLYKSRYEDKDLSRATEVLREFLDSSTYPADYERELLKGMLNSESSLLSSDECFDRLTTLIRAVVGKEQELNNVVHAALFDCLYNAHDSVKKAIPEATNIFTEAQSKFQSLPYLDLWVEKNWRSKEPSLQFAVHHTAALVFGSWDGFEQHVQSLPSDPVIEEFRAFYSAFKATGHKTYVPFPFQYLKQK